MPDIIKCPLCHRQLQIDAGCYGQWFKCPSCGGTFQIAAAPGSPARAAAPAAAPPERPAVPPRVWQPPAPSAAPRPAPPVREDLDLRKQVSGVPPVPHRGILVLALGFIALALFAVSPVGWILGGMAVAMGGDDLGRMQRGTMDRGGEIMTLIGRVCGLIAVIFSTLVLFYYLVIFFRTQLGG